MAGEVLLLASASPRRRELLASAGLRFEVGPVAVEEDLDEFAAPEEAALELATRKALAAATLVATRSDARRWVIGADTIVAVPARGGAGWRLLGKAADEREADEMLATLSGSRHAVVTGVCVARTPDLEQWRAVERTWVTMRAITPAERGEYVRSGEWRDKAGAYAIQENADRFVTALEEGGFDNVVGLPVALTVRLLREAGAPIDVRASPGGLAGA